MIYTFQPDSKEFCVTCSYEIKPIEDPSYCQYTVEAYELDEYWDEEFIGSCEVRVLPDRYLQLDRQHAVISKINIDKEYAADFIANVIDILKAAYHHDIRTAIVISHDDDSLLEVLDELGFDNDFRMSILKID